MTRSPVARISACASLVLAACAGGKPPAETPRAAICSVDTTLGMNKPPADREFPAQYWFVLLIRGYESSGVVARPTSDCTGAAARWAPPPCPELAEPKAVEPRPLTARDLLVTHLGGGRRLVWAMTDRLADGEAQGPVALAEIDGKGIKVSNLGVLRSYPLRAKLRLEHVGKDDLLVAEGELCGEEDEPSRCDRALRVMPLLRDRFVARTLVGEGGQCVGDSLLPVRSTGVLGSGAEAKRYQLDAAISFAGEAITIHEQLQISPVSAVRGADAAPEFVTRVQADRQVTLRNGSLIATAPSLLVQWMRRQRQ